MNAFARAWPVRRPIETGLAVLTVLAAAGLVLVSDPRQVFVFVAGLAALGLCLSRPILGLLALIGLLASVVFERSIPSFTFAGLDVQATHVLFLGLLVPLLGRAVGLARPRFLRTPLDAPLLAFVIVATLCAFRAVFLLAGNPVAVVRGVRELAYYLLFFLVTNFVRTAGQVRKVLAGLFALAALTAALMVAQELVGDSVQLIAGSVKAAQTESVVYAAARIQPPGQTLLYVMFLVAASLLAVGPAGRPKLGAGILFSVFGVGILLTYWRNYWLSLLFCLGILVVWTAGKPGRRRLTWLAGPAAALVLAFTILPSAGGKAGGIAASLQDRFSSIFSVKRTIRGGSLEWRRVENAYAKKAIAASPVLGFGLARPYRPLLRWMDHPPEMDLTAFVHNGYYGILLNTGAIGFLAYAWAFGAFLRRAATRWRRIRDATFRAAVLGFALFGLGALLMSFVNPIFLQWFSIVVLAVVMGLAETIYRIEGLGPAGRRDANPPAEEAS